jgi:hypothetical protein
MINDSDKPQCPFLEEMVVLYCQAYPVRKPVPKHQITANNPCMGQGYKRCPFFNEIMAELGSAAGDAPGGGSVGR